MSASLAIAGDVFVSRANFEEGEPVDAGFGEVVSLLRGADVAFANFEVPLSERGWPVEKLITIRTSPARAGEARDLGLDVVSLASNHIMDYGPEALEDTIAALDAQGVPHVGAGRDLAAANAPVVLDAGGLRVGFLSWSTCVPTGSGASVERPGVAEIRVRIALEITWYRHTEEPTRSPETRTWVEPADVEAATRLVESLREQVDVLVASVHWGHGLDERLGDFQRPLAHALVDAGADVVAGNHPHLVHPIEVYRGRPILYGPGLFLEQVPREGATPQIRAIYDLLSRDSYVALVEVAAPRDLRLRVVPTVSGDDGLPRLARGGDFDRIAAHLERLSAPFGTTFPRDGDTLAVPLVAEPAGTPA